MKINNLLTKRVLWHFVSSSFAVFGIIAVILGVLDVSVPNTFNFGRGGFFLLTGLSLVVGAIRAYPRRNFARLFDEPDTRITIKIGDLFDEAGHIAVGMSDTFDVEVGEIISPNCVQGQLLSKRYRGDAKSLSSAIEQSLSGEEYSVDESKKKGNNKRYSVGTTALLDTGKHKYFCTALSRMSADLVAQSDVSLLNHALMSLWAEVRNKIQQEPLSVPVLGAGLSRLNTSYTFLIKQIIFSFLQSSKEKIVTKEMIVVIHPNDQEKVNFAELKDFLNTL